MKGVNLVQELGTLIRFSTSANWYAFIALAKHSELLEKLLLNISVYVQNFKDSQTDLTEKNKASVFILMMQEQLDCDRVTEKLPKPQPTF